MQTCLRIVGLALLLCLSRTGWAQASDSPRLNVVKVNPLSIFASTFNARWEHGLGDRFSLLLGAHVGAPKLHFNADLTADGIRYFLLGVTPELRYYISFVKNKPPKGLYASTHLRLAYVRQRFMGLVYEPGNLAQFEAAVLTRRKVISFGFLVGYQFLIKGRLAIDAFIGPQYSSSVPAYEIQCPTCDGDERVLGSPGLRFDGVEPRGGLSVGYAF